LLEPVRHRDGPTPQHLVLRVTALVRPALISICSSTPVANVTSNLLGVAAPGDVANANCSPAQLGHHLCKVPVSTRRTLALRDLSDVHQRLWEIRSGPSYRRKSANSALYSSSKSGGECDPPPRADRSSKRTKLRSDVRGFYLAGVKVRMPRLFIRPAAALTDE
jgi:hypothetical protein